MTDRLTERLERLESLERRLEGTAFRAEAWQPGLAAATSIAWQLFPTARLGRTQSGTVVIVLSDGSSLVLRTAPSDLLDGEARPLHRDYYVSINGGAAKAIFELTAALWLDGRLCADIGAIDRLAVPSLLHADVPRGLEHIWACVYERTDGAMIAARRMLPAWLEEEYPLLQHAGRQDAFRRSFRAGLRYLWLHEIAHVLLGHLNLSSGASGKARFNEVSNLAMAEPHSNRHRSSAARRALEFQADRFAFDRVLLPKRGPGKEPSRINVLPELIGCVSVLTLLHAANAFAGSDDTAAQHPPLWFRAVEALRSFRSSASQPSIEAHRENPTHYGIDPGLAAIRDVAAIHPLFGSWFGALADGAYAGAATKLEQQLLSELSTHRARQKELLKEVVERPADVAPFDRFVSARTSGGSSR
ncbi:MAG: hypothetical protein AAF830_16760 [Pseudomonadota bacterium]